MVNGDSNAEVGKAMAGDERVACPFSTPFAFRNNVTASLLMHLTLVGRNATVGFAGLSISRGITKMGSGQAKLQESTQ